MISLPIGALKYSYEEFPDNKDYVEGMKTLKADMSEPLMGVDINIEYAVKDDYPLHLEIIYPRYEEKPSNKYPLIMYIQGSAWRKQPIAREIPQLVRFAKRGYVVAVVEYRPSTIAMFPAQIKDTITATRFMIKNAEMYNIDTDNIFMWGHSSGGHTAAMIDLINGDPEFTDEKDERSIDIKGYIDFFGPSDIYKMGKELSSIDAWGADSPQGQLLGGVRVDENRDLAYKASPVAYVNKEKDIKPILIFHGSKDRLVPFRQSVYLYEALKKAGKDVEFYKIEGADHSIHPTYTAFYSKEVLDIIEAFIKSNGTKK